MLLTEKLEKTCQPPVQLDLPTQSTMNEIKGQMHDTKGLNSVQKDQVIPSHSEDNTQSIKTLEVRVEVEKKQMENKNLKNDLNSAENETNASANKENDQVLPNHSEDPTHPKETLEVQVEEKKVTNDSVNNEKIQILPNRSESSKHMEENLVIQVEERKEANNPVGKGNPLKDKCINTISVKKQ